MSDIPFYFSPSSEFVTLCDTQIALLREGLGATWAAVYLTQSFAEGRPRKLIPVAVYSDRESYSEDQDNYVTHLREIDLEVDTSYPLLPPSLSREEKLSFMGKHQMVFPLIYEEVVLGLLIALRADSPWNSQELAQIAKISQTIAVARILDQRQSIEQYRLQNQEDKIDDFLHQLRNPLTALRTFGKLLLKRLQPEDRNHSIAKNILQQSDRLEELLKQLENNRQETLTIDSPSVSSFLLPSNSLPVQSIAVKDILDPLVVSARAIAQEKGISLNFYLPPSMDTKVAAHKQALGEVLNNLIDNAIKYTPSGGKVEIRVVEKLVDNLLWQGIVIADTGYGIPPQDQEHIFERHYRGEKALSDIAGSGLGLAIAKNLVEQMHGKIQLISPLPQQLSNFDSQLPGTVFIVWLPVIN